METLSWIVLRTFNQSNERRRVLGNTNHLNLVAFDPQFRHIGAIGQCPRDRFEHHDARWRRLLAFGRQALGRSAPNPSLVVINNQVATLQAGDVVPVSTGSATVLTTNNTVVNTIDYRNTGIILRVSPRINVNGNVRLDVEQEISNVSPQTVQSLTPTVSERRVKSSVSVATGQTVLLAGLISEQQNKDRNGIPLLDQIQGLGDAFSHQDKKNTRTELIIFIRPQIIRDGNDAHFVAEELRSKLRGNIGTSLANDTRGPR